MVSITLPGVKAAQAIELVNELKAAGLILNQDFEWNFHQTTLNKVDGKTELRKRYCEFKFRDPKLATFYALKWHKMTT